MIALIVIIGMNAMAAEKKYFSTKPITNDGQRWRIGYYEGGEYIDYQKTLIETVQVLMKLGWIQELEIPSQLEDQTVNLWGWLATEVNSDYIEFVPDAHYSANWDSDKRHSTVETILDRLTHKNDLDLMIAMGTWAGKDLANNRHHTPTIVLSSSDPLAAGIIKSVEDSGFEHVHATVDPYLFKRQIRIFHDIIGFKKLGVAYEDTVSGRSYAAIDVADDISKEIGFELVRCQTQSDISNIHMAEQSVIKCFKELSQAVDAIYVTQQGGVNNQTIPELVRFTNKYRIPTFSQSGSEEVNYGFLLSLSHAGFKYVGEFHAITLAKILNGAKPNELNQLFEEPPKIAINLETAEVIGFNPSLQLLGAADEIFTKIVVPK